MLDRAALARVIARQGPVVRVVVAEVRGSAPREPGAEMLVWPGGQSGTIGGGALELAATEEARRTTRPRALPFALGPALGQCCGGAVTLVLEPFAEPPPSGRPFVRHISGEAPKPAAIARAEAQAAAGGTVPALIWRDGWLFETEGRPEAEIWVWGAGHVGREIVDILAGLPVAVTWADTGPERFPDPPPESVRLLPSPELAAAAALAPPDAHHLILTYSHELDLALCHALLGRPAASIGLIGSATKWARFRARLARLGHTPEAIERIHCPIGDPALGKHPRAIALGVAAELMQSVARPGKERKTA